MQKLIGVLGTAIITFSLLIPIAVGAGDDETWFLMARHGECQSINVLQRKIPQIGGVKNPESFKKLMESMGHKAIVKNLKGLEGKAVEISVPDKGLGLIFVKKSVCKKLDGK